MSRHRSAMRPHDHLYTRRSGSPPIVVTQSLETTLLQIRRASSQSPVIDRSGTSPTGTTQALQQMPVHHPVHLSKPPQRCATDSGHPGLVTDPFGTPYPPVHSRLRRHRGGSDVGDVRPRESTVRTSMQPMAARHGRQSAGHGPRRQPTAPGRGQESQLEPTPLSPQRPVDSSGALGAAIHPRRRQQKVAEE